MEVYPKELQVALVQFLPACDTVVPRDGHG